METAFHFRHWADEVRCHGVEPPSNCASVLCPPRKFNVANGLRISSSWGHPDSHNVVDSPCKALRCRAGTASSPSVSRRSRLPLKFGSTLFTSFVLPSISWGSEFLLTSPNALRLLNSASRRWGTFLLGWPPGSPVASVFLGLGVA